MNTFEKIKEKYGALKPMMVNLEVAKMMDRKSQTRRIVNTKIYADEFLSFWGKKQLENTLKLSKWQIGDVLWVREPAKIEAFEVSKGVFEISYADDNFTKRYDFEMPQKHIKKSWTTKRGRVPNGCIKEMARDFRIVTNVRVERLQDIEHDDILEEGFCKDYEMKDLSKTYFNDDNGIVDYFDDLTREWFMNLWNKTANKGYKWEDNPYVFVYDLEKIA